MEKNEEFSPIKVNEVFALRGAAFEAINCEEGIEDQGLFPTYSQHEAYFLLDNEEEMKRLEKTLFIFKYLGNGKVKEFSTGTDFLIAGFGSEDKFEDGIFEDFPSLIDCEDYATFQKEIPKLIEFYKENPIIVYDEMDTYAIRNLDDSFKASYMVESDDYRKEIINKLIKISLESISDLGKEMTEYSQDMAYLENQLYHFKKGK